MTNRLVKIPRQLRFASVGFLLLLPWQLGCRTIDCEEGVEEGDTLVLRLLEPTSDVDVTLSDIPSCDGFDSLEPGNCFAR